MPYDGHVVGVDGDQLVVDGTDHPITTLNAAAAAIGITPDASQQGQFDVPPHGDLDEPLGVDPAAARALGDWYAFATELLDTLRAEAGGRTTTRRSCGSGQSTSTPQWSVGDSSASCARGAWGGSPSNSRHSGTSTSTYRRGRAGSTASSMSPRSWAPPLPRDRLVDDPDPTGVALRFLREARDQIRGSVCKNRMSQLFGLGE